MGPCGYAGMSISAAPGGALGPSSSGGPCIMPVGSSDVMNVSSKPLDTGSRKTVPEKTTHQGKEHDNSRAANKHCSRKKNTESQHTVGPSGGELIGRHARGLRSLALRNATQCRFERGGVKTSAGRTENPTRGGAAAAT